MFRSRSISSFGLFLKGRSSLMWRDTAGDSPNRTLVHAVVKRLRLSSSFFVIVGLPTGIPNSVVLVIGAWSLWKWWNAKVFNGKEEYGEKFKFVLSLAKEYWCVSKQARGKVGGLSNRVGLIQWERPEGDWIKVNTNRRLHELSVNGTGGVSSGTSMGIGSPSFPTILGLVQQLWRKSWLCLMGWTWR
ncbi:hypothetical protein V2J09_003633 [Rumex salicifolius]